MNAYLFVFTKILKLNYYKTFISVTTLCFLTSCSSDININTSSLKLFAYSESSKEITVLTRSSDEKLCSQSYEVAFSATINENNKIQIKKYFCWNYIESKQLVKFFDPNSILFKSKTIDVNKFVLIKTKEQIESEEFRSNFENFVSKDINKNNSQQNNLAIIPVIINTEPKMCIFIGNILNCD